MSLKVGFTGTQIGMTPEQVRRFTDFMHHTRDCYNGAVEFHHGDCIGADKEAHDIVRPIYETKIVLHPPDIDSKRAFCEADESLKPLPYITRNHCIVDSVDMMVATPKEKDEVLRSGTWATVRYSKKTKTDLVIIHPDGTFQIIIGTQDKPEPA